MERKNVFGLELETQKIDGGRLVLREIDKELQTRQETLEKESSAYEKKAELPLWVKIIMYACIYIGLLGFVAIVRNEDAFTVDKTATIIGLVVCGVLLLVALFIWLLGKSKSKEAVKSEEFQEVEKKTNELIEESFESLGVPKEYKTVDVFVFPYKLKKGKVKRAVPFADYINASVRLFVEEGKLCLADLSLVVGIPLENIERIVKVDKRATSLGWTKEEGYNEGVYKQYKIRVNSYGTLFIKPYYKIEFSVEAQPFELIVPCYDIQPFVELTGLTPVEEEKKK